MTYEDALSIIMHEDKEAEAIKVLTESLDGKYNYYYEQNMHARAVIRAVRKINADNPDAKSRRAGIAAFTESDE